MLRKVVWLAFVAMVLLAIFRAIPHDAPGLYAMAQEYVPAVTEFIGSITDAINEGLNAPDGSPSDPDAPPDPEGGSGPDSEPQPDKSPADAPEAP